MKKIILCMLCLMLGASFLTGCSEKSDNAFEKKSYNSKDIELSGINIDVRDRKIEVVLSNDNQIHIDYFENGKEYYDISVSDDNILNMSAKNSKEWSDYIGGKSDADNRKIFLQIPDNFLKTLSLSTTNADITITAMTITNSVLISSNGGDTVFDKLNAGSNITLKSKNGDISGTIIGGYDDYAINCEIKKGKSNLPEKKEDGAKTLNVLNNNGNINIKFAKE